MRIDTGQPASGVVEERATSLRGWADLICERFVTLRIAPSGGMETRGTVRTSHLGPLQASTVRSTPQTFVRTKSLVSKESSHLLAVGLVDRGTGQLSQDGRSCAVADGGFALYDTSRPFAWQFNGDFRMRVYTWPFPQVPLTDKESQRITAITVPGLQGIGRLVAPIFRQVTLDTPEISVAGSMRVAAELAELAITAALETGRQPEGDGALMPAIQAFIDKRLAEPTLNADLIAAAFYMSTRTLNRLFARRGLTVAGWIKFRRLEGSRRALVAGGASNASIRDVAAGHGFSNPSYFSREFAAQYGESPRQYRSRRQA